MIRVADTDTGSGLLIAEQAASHEHVARLLKQHDPSLRLIPQGGAGGGVLWTVYSWNGPDRPGTFVCAWQTPHGDPLPLSSRLLEKVQQLDKRTVGDPPDPDKANAAHVAAVRRDRRNALDAVADEHRPYIDRGRVSVQVPRQPGKAA
jgi:hypothetical protein